MRQRTAAHSELGENSLAMVSYIYESIYMAEPMKKADRFIPLKTQDSSQAGYCGRMNLALRVYRWLARAFPHEFKLAYRNSLP